MSRVYNFSAGPAVLPEEVLKEAAAEMLDYNGNVIEQEFKQGSNWNVGSGLSLVLMLFIIASMALIAKYDKNGEGNTF